MFLSAFRKHKYRVHMCFSILLAAALLAGCGRGQSRQFKATPGLSEEELSAMQYIEKIEVEDYYGDGAGYEVYAPKESENEEGMASYFGRGMTYFASACSTDSTSYLYKYLDDTVEYTTEDWRDENFGNARDVKLGKVKKNGEDRYQIASATKENVFDGILFETIAVFYLDVQKEGAGVLWKLELEEGNVDEETQLIIKEIAACYGIDLDEVSTAVGEWIVAESDRVEERQDVYEPAEGDIVLEEVEGYQYMGVTTLTAGDGETECPVMAPRGWSVDIWDNYVTSYLHGVSVDGSLGIISPPSLLKNVESEIGISYGVYQKDQDTYRDVRKTNIMPVSGYEEAFYAVITYEELDRFTEEYLPRVRVCCFFKVSDDYALEYDIRLYQSDYDNSTNMVIKELETAYGIDLSEYYHEEEQETKN